MWKLIKTADHKFAGDHPNKINIGNEVIGSFIGEPSVGYSFVFYNVLGDSRRFTSKVTWVSPDKTEFKTQNSTYKLQRI